MTNDVDGLIREAEDSGYDVGAIVAGRGFFEGCQDRSGVVVSRAPGGATTVIRRRSYRGIPVHLSNVEDDEHVRVVCKNPAHPDVSSR